MSGGAHVDGNTGAQLAVDNVIVQYVPHQATDIVEDSLGSTSIRLDLFGSGQAIVFRDGQAFEGTWRSESRGDTPRFFDASGAEIPLKPGTDVDQCRARRLRRHVSVANRFSTEQIGTAGPLDRPGRTFAADLTRLHFECIESIGLLRLCAPGACTKRTAGSDNGSGPMVSSRQPAACASVQCMMPELAADAPIPVFGKHAGKQKPSGCGRVDGCARQATRRQR